MNEELFADSMKADAGSRQKHQQASCRMPGMRSRLAASIRVACPGLIVVFLMLLSPLVSGSACQSAGTSQQKEGSHYETRIDHDPDGIGRFYMGREIAHVMGHRGAAWLERPDRAETELPDQVVAQMQLRPDDVVADIGAGTGYFTFRLAQRVPRGRVYATDIQPEMLSLIEQKKRATRAANVITVQGSETDCRLEADAVDVVLMVDVYHEFSWPREMMQSIARCLRPGGRVVLIEYRGEDPAVPIKRLHKMTVAQARKEMAAVGLKWQETRDFLPQQHFMVFARPAAAEEKK